MKEDSPQLLSSPVGEDFLQLKVIRTYTPNTIPE